MRVILLDQCKSFSSFSGILVLIYECCTFENYLFWVAILEFPLYMLMLFQFLSNLKIFKCLSFSSFLLIIAWEVYWKSGGRFPEFRKVISYRGKPPARKYDAIWNNEFSVAKATLHSQMSVRSFVPSVSQSVTKTPQQLQIIILHHSSFILPSFRDF